MAGTLPALMISSLRILYVPMLAGMFMLVDTPDGFIARSVVPYDPESKLLVSDARVCHERNGYSASPIHHPYSTVKEEQVFRAN